MSKSDKISAVIATVAVLTLLGSYFTNRKRDKNSILRLNRAERIGIYAIAVAGLSARTDEAISDAKYTELVIPSGTRTSSARKLVIGVPNRVLTTREKNDKLDAERSINEMRTWQFTSRFDLMASEKVVVLWNEINDRYVDRQKAFEDACKDLKLGYKQNRIDDSGTRMKMEEIRTTWLEDLSEIKKMVGKLRDKIVKEVAVRRSIARFVRELAWNDGKSGFIQKGVRRFRGTTEAQEKEIG